MALTDKLTAIADAIRGKTGKTAGLTLEQMATEQDAVFDAGKQAEYDRFWDSFQQNGERNVYNYAFSYRFGWTDAVYNPKYPIKAYGANAISYCFAYNSAITDTKVPVRIVKAAGSGSAGQATNVFNGCSALKTIQKLIVDESTTFSNTFNGCTALENLTMEGTIGQNGFNVSACTKLTHDSLMSIVNCLQAKTGGSFALTLGATNLAKLTDAEKAIATGKGWTLA